MPNKNTIPDFDASSLESVATAVRAMKDIVEVLAGLRQGEALGAPQMFVQDLTPGALTAQRNSAVPLTTGDLWVNTAARTLNYYDGRQFVEILSASVTP